MQNHHGFSIIESLTALALVGIIMMLAVMAINSMLEGNASMLRSEAYTVALRELKTLSLVPEPTDANYKTPNGRFAVERTVEQDGDLYIITISVKRARDGEPIYGLTGYVSEP